MFGVVGAFQHGIVGIEPVPVMSTLLCHRSRVVLNTEGELQTKFETGLSELLGHHTI